MKHLTEWESSVEKYLKLRPPGNEDLRPQSSYVLGVVIVVILTIVLTPGRPADSAQEHLQAWFRYEHRHWLPTFITYSILEWLANVLMFVPLGILASLLTSQLRVFVGAVTLSAGVELTQYLALSHRVGSVRDLLANVSGALLGILVASALFRRQTAVPVLTNDINTI